MPVHDIDRLELLCTWISAQETCTTRQTHVQLLVHGREIAWIVHLEGYVVRTLSGKGTVSNLWNEKELALGSASGSIHKRPYSSRSLIPPRVV